MTEKHQISILDVLVHIVIFASTQSQCMERIISRDFFTINREIESMVAIFDELQEDEKIIRRKGDYQVRQSQNQ